MDITDSGRSSGTVTHTGRGGGQETTTGPGGTHGTATTGCGTKTTLTPFMNASVAVQTTSQTMASARTKQFLE